MKKLFSLIFIFAFVITSCKKNNRNEQIYRGLYDADVTTFNYLLTNEYDDITRIANLVDGLVEHDKYGNIVPSIAKSWKSEIINDKQIWTFYLKDDVNWSDYKGNIYDKVTAYDFVTTLKYILNYNSKSNNYTLPIKLLDNAEEYYYGTMLENYDYNDIISHVEQLKEKDSYNNLFFYEEIKNTFDKCNYLYSCHTDFDKVGVKALSDFELQFTLRKPVPYFLSALTYYSFLPSNDNFIKSVGFNNFGSNKKNLLYCGAYILGNYSHSSKLEFIKNNNYWDAENVFIDKLIFIKSLNYHYSEYSRFSYEANNIDEFVLDETDVDGWNKYVVGKSKNGTADNPQGNNTYVSDYNSNVSTLYLVFNQNRTGTRLTTLSDEEIQIGNLAMKNNNFRKALTYGLSKNSYLSENDDYSLFSIIPKNFISNNDKEYTSYFIETYADKMNISYDDAYNLFITGTIFNAEKSNYYLDLSLNELNLTSNQLPIKIEFSYFADDSYVLYDIERIKNWNNILNGCDIKEMNCNFNKVEIVYNTKVNSTLNYDIAFNNKEYGITLVGLYPDFYDPTSYLESFGSLGELKNFLNHSSKEIISLMLDEISNYYLEENLDTRYKLCSELEYYILFEENLVLPLFLNGLTKKIIVSNLLPFQKMFANYGLSPFKFKYKKLITEDLSQADINNLRLEYESGRK